MKRSIYLVFFILIVVSVNSQSKSNLDPFTLLTKVLNFSGSNSFSGVSEVGSARGNSFFDFSKWTRQSPNVIVTYTAYGRSAREAGVLRNFRFKNTGNFKTKVLLADWQNFDKNSGSGIFEMSLFDEKYPNKLYLGLKGSSWSYFFNLELNSEQFQELVTLLDYTTSTLDAGNKLITKKSTTINLNDKGENNFKIYTISNYQIKYNKDTKLDWDEVFDIAIKSKKNNFNTWRLPTIEELKEIYQFRNNLGITSGVFWSSTIQPPDRMGLFSCIDFSNGDDGIIDNGGQHYYLLIKTTY